VIGGGIIERPAWSGLCSALAVAGRRSPGVGGQPPAPQGGPPRIWYHFGRRGPQCAGHFQRQAVSRHELMPASNWVTSMYSLGWCACAMSPGPQPPRVACFPKTALPRCRADFVTGVVAGDHGAQKGSASPLFSGLSAGTSKRGVISIIRFRGRPLAYCCSTSRTFSR